MTTVAQSTSCNKRVVLLIEDNPRYGQELSLCLKALGCNVIWLTGVDCADITGVRGNTKDPDKQADTDEAGSKQIIGWGEVDAVILDAQLKDSSERNGPGLNGWDVLREIALRNNPGNVSGPENPQRPVWVMAVSGNRLDNKWMTRNGAHGSSDNKQFDWHRFTQEVIVFLVERGVLSAGPSEE